MADFDATEVTECIVDRKKGMRTRDTAGAEIARLTGLDLDVAKALTDGWSGKNISQIRSWTYENEGCRKKREARLGKVSI